MEIGFLWQFKITKFRQVKGAQIFQQRASHKREHFKQNDSSSFSKLEIDYKIMRLHNRRKVCTYLTGFFYQIYFFHTVS